MEDFLGSKGALICGDRVAVLRRDDFAHIPWPNMLDLPGGARDPGETPRACLVREIHEELGVCLPEDRFTYARQYSGDAAPTWFFAGVVSEAEVAAMVLGDEGQSWGTMPVAEFLAHPDAIVHLQDRLRTYLERV